MTSATTYTEALDLIPDPAKWACSFGNPGQGGYREIWHADGRRFEIGNGRFDALKPFTWTVRALDPANDDRCTMCGETEA